MANNDALVQRIVQIIQTHANPKQGLSNLKQNQNIVPGIVAIIKKSVGTNAVKVINAAPTNDVAKAITKLIQNSVKISGPVTVAAIPPLVKGGQGPVAAEVIKQANARDVATAITKLIQNSVRIPPPVAAAAVQTLQTEPIPEHLSLIERLKGIKWPWSGFFSGKGKMPIFGPETQPNFVEPVKTGVNNQGRNRGAVAPPNGPATGPVGPTTQPRNYTKMSIRELLDAMKKYPENRSTIMDALRKALEKAIRDIKYEYSKSRRVRKLGDLLRLLPRNYNGRRNASSIVIDDIRNTRNGRELSNVRSNLGRVPNENIRRAFEEQRRRLERNRTTDTESGSRRTPIRRYGESNTNYTQRIQNTSSDRELLELMRRRRSAYLGGGGGGNGGGGNGGGGNGGGGNGGGGVPPLPPNQRQAINNAGGVNRAMNAVVQVPGGAPEIAKAAEALNESRGNTTYAITVKGASPAAVNAVQKLGGPNNTVHVLEGLNTMSKTHGTRKRKAARRIARPKKRKGPRVAELNRVINAVKKQRLISLVAHNVTKTHNIHPNDEKLKKYYKKVLKANILRTPFAKIVKGAATRKRVPPGLKA